MARTPAYVEDNGDTIRLVCDVCGECLYERASDLGGWFTDMVDAHEEHADKVHGEGV